MEVVNALGRRKAAVARVFVCEGSGVVTINKRELAVYFPSSILQYIVKPVSYTHLRAHETPEHGDVYKRQLVTRVPLNVRNRDVPKLVRDSSSVNVNMRRPETEDIFVFSIQTARTFLFMGDYLVVV